MGRARGKLQCRRSVVPAPPGVVMVAPPTVPRNALVVKALLRHAMGRDKAKGRAWEDGEHHGAAHDMSIIAAGAPRTPPYQKRLLEIGSNLGSIGEVSVMFSLEGTHKDRSPVGPRPYLLIISSGAALACLPRAS